MSDRNEEIDILDVDRTRDGIIVTFTNGASALFRPRFLFEMRDHDGNVQLEQPSRGKRPDGRLPRGSAIE